MTPEEINRRIEEGRRFVVHVSHAIAMLDTGRVLTFDLLLPSDLDVRSASARAIQGDGRVDVVRAQHDMVAAAVVGWSGVTVQDLIPDLPPDPLPWDRALVRPLLANRLDLEDRLAAEIHQRREAREAARKNSPSASPTS